MLSPIYFIHTVVVWQKNRQLFKTNNTTALRKNENLFWFRYNDKIQKNNLRLFTLITIENVLYCYNLDIVHIN